MTVLEGAVAVITGAGRRGGLGEGIARRFAEENAHIVLSDLGRPAGEQFPEQEVGTRSELDEVAEGVRAVGGKGRVLTVEADVRDEREVADLVAATVRELGGVDVLVNNAGVGYLMSPLVEVSEADWDAVVDVNLKGVFLCSKHAVARMIEQGRGGRVINIASQAAKSGFPLAAAYTSSKHGVVGFTRSAATELGRHGITVNAVCPNHVTTQLGAWQNAYFARALGQSEEDYLAAMRARIPLGRPGIPLDTANACVFLASEQAAYITGEALNVSGGEETH